MIVNNLASNRPTRVNFWKLGPGGSKFQEIGPPDQISVADQKPHPTIQPFDDVEGYRYGAVQGVL